MQLQLRNGRDGKHHPGDHKQGHAILLPPQRQGLRFDPGQAGEGVQITGFAVVTLSREAGEVSPKATEGAALAPAPRRQSAQDFPPLTPEKPGLSALISPTYARSFAPGVYSPRRHQLPRVLTRCG